MRALMHRCELLSRARLLVAGSVLLVSACNALDAPGPKGSLVIIPVDDRPALLTAAPPAAISGGTLAVSADGVTAVAADPDRDRVSIVDLSTNLVRHVTLQKGDEPGRVVLDPAGRAFVALRRAGALAVIDLVQGSVVQRMPICAGPRGMAFDALQGLLHVACMEGRLLSLRSAASSSALEVAKDVRVELDLRDVIIQGDQLWVSTFKRAELLRVDQAGQVQQRLAPQSFTSLDFASFDPARQNGSQSEMLPRVAYRSLADGAGNMFVLHQAESDGEVAIDQPADGGGGSPYGGVGACSGIVTPALTKIEPNGRIKTLPTSSGVLSVDMAFASDQNLLAVVQAGASDGDAPQRQTFFDNEGSFGDAPTSAASAPSFFGGSASGSGTLVTLFDVAQPDSSCKFGQSIMVPGQSTAIAVRPRGGAITDPSFSASAGWVVQSREPARLTVLPTRPDFNAEIQQIELGGESMRDSGHEIFHRDAGGGIACASCHAEGGEDGHVWHFTRLGARRTQALHIGLEGTAPFHWGGDESDLDNLMTDVFVGRMGGVHQGTTRISALSRWLFALQPPAAPVSADDAAVERGRELFMSAAVGCNDCHNGDKLTNNRNLDVGTGAALQVPSLRGIAYRAPFMHDGCAATLRDRFSIGCGGASHGRTAQLSTESVDDLVAFLQTL